MNAVFGRNPRLLIEDAIFVAVSLGGAWTLGFLLGFG